MHHYTIEKKSSLLLFQRMFSLHLSGKKLINESTLLGKSNFHQASDTKNQALKTEIYNRFVIPLLSKQWQILYENLFFVPKYKMKIKGNPDLEVYETLFAFLHVLAEEHKELETLERKMHLLNKSSQNQVLSMVYKTKRIKLLPQYEIYDMILGKPSREKGEHYKSEIVSLIASLLQKESITFSQIREKVSLMP